MTAPSDRSTSTPVDTPDDSPDLDLVFHALADPSRRKIIGLLREAGELRVGDLARAFSMTLNGVSKHLKVLEGASLVARRIEGREHWIRVRWNGLQPAYGWLHFHQQFWTERLDALVDYVEAQERREMKGEQKRKGKAISQEGPHGAPQISQEEPQS